MELKKIFLPLLTAAALALSALPANAAAEAAAAAPAAKAIRITDTQGEKAVPLKPRRVVVFDMGALDNLNRLGVKSVIGLPQLNSWPPYLKQYQSKAYARTGTLFEPDYEAVAALKPDLIIVAARSQPKYQQLARLAPTLDLTIRNTHYIADMQRNITILGQIFGKERQAKAENAALTANIAALKAKAANQGAALAVMTTGGKINAFGPGSRFGLVYDAFGMKPADPNLSRGKHGQPVSPEYILAKNPDWLIVIDRDAAIGAAGAAARQVLDNPLIAGTKAAKAGHIIYFDPSWYLDAGGLTLTNEIISQLNAAFAKAKQP